MLKLDSLRKWVSWYSQLGPQVKTPEIRMSDELFSQNIQLPRSLLILPLCPSTLDHFQGFFRVSGAMVGSVE
ncbi:hypothetical protein AMATHDRAFT_68418 [Amanita thiersii Skay4041]|uniref:Uncharacterized protein n=1 Tax=Amanita thiersii Skay4041 TaxID=703135 RepID=A0A2A9NFR8_9AGAR|nr:hypothetical protein AMATHDRAFT_68418 [Amanita thiersii Skay4041]